MPQIKKSSVLMILLLTLGLLSFVACGDANKTATFDSSTGEHPAGWVASGHAAAANEDINSCTECHGSDLSGGITGVACTSCHVNGSPMTNPGCTSCHGTPPNGATAPNRTGAHNTVTGHFAPQVSLPDSCDTCHSGAGFGTANHANGVVDVQFLSIYSAKSGSAVHNADGSCSNVSCHGGQNTPAWLTGKIDVNTQCTSCHAYGTDQYNSFNSGQHYLHAVSQGILCTACHETSKLVANHFKYLNTSIMEGPAAATIQDAFGYNGVTCSPGCHETRTWQ